MTVRVLVIGTGFGARVVAPVFAATEGCEVVAVVSARDDSAIDRALGTHAVDLVSVHSPPFLHARHVRRALEAAVPAVLCDKPLAGDPGEAEALQHDADTAGALHFVNFEFRCDPARAAMRALVADGAIGPVEHVVWTHHSAGTRVPLRPYGWLFDAQRGGGWVGAWASHAVDTLRWLLDDELTVDRALPRTDVTERPDADGVLQRCTAEDGLTALLHAATTGATISIDSTFAAAASIAPRLVLFGPDGVIENVADERVVVRRAGGTRHDQTFTGDSSRDRHLVPMQHWAARVRDCVRAGVTLDDVPTFADGLACDRVLAELRAHGPRRRHH